MSTNSVRGDAFREMEATTGTRIGGPFAIVRVDGKAFHTFTRRLAKPFDDRMTDAMIGATVAVSQSDMPCLIGYTQSDEASFVITAGRAGGDHWYGGKVQKIVSVAAAMFTAHFNKQIDVDRLGFFDARVFAVPDLATVADYLDWRMGDARRNSISAAAHAKFGHSKLAARGTNERLAMLADTDSPWESLPARDQLGTIVWPETKLTAVEYVDRRNDQPCTADALRRTWHAGPADPRSITQLLEAA